MMRVRRAAALGLTVEEYTLEILERGRYLTAADGAHVDAIKARRTGREEGEGAAERSDVG